MPSVPSDVKVTKVDKEVMAEIKHLLEVTGERKFEVMEAAIDKLEQEKRNWIKVAELRTEEAEECRKENEQLRKVNTDIREEIRNIKDTHQSLHERHNKLAEENETWRNVVKMLLDK